MSNEGTSDSDREEETLEDLYNEERVFRESLLKVLSEIKESLDGIDTTLGSIGAELERIAGRLR